MLAIHENLKKRVAVITGGSGVLCSMMAIELGRQGMRVAIINRTVEKGQKVVKVIEQSGGEAVAIAADVLSKQSLIEAKQTILAKYGQIDLLINGAGGNHPDAITEAETFAEHTEGKSFFDLEETGFMRVFSVNFQGTLLASQVFGEELLKSASPVIINISSMSAYHPMTKVPAYSAAKASINNFTEWLAVHFAMTGLRVNAIAPGFFETTQNKDLLRTPEGDLTARSEKILTSTPMKRFGKPDDLLGTLLFLVDEAYSSFVTGVTIPVDGGFNSYSGV